MPVGGPQRPSRLSSRGPKLDLVLENGMIKVKGKKRGLLLAHAQASVLCAHHPPTHFRFRAGVSWEWRSVCGGVHVLGLLVAAASEEPWLRLQVGRRRRREPLATAPPGRPPLGPRSWGPACPSCPRLVPRRSGPGAAPGLRREREEASSWTKDTAATAPGYRTGGRRSHVTRTLSKPSGEPCGEEQRPPANSAITEEGPPAQNVFEQDTAPARWPPPGSPEPELAGCAAPELLPRGNGPSPPPHPVLARAHLGRNVSTPVCSLRSSLGEDGRASLPAFAALEEGSGLR
ncbi:methyl-CpG-binding domain protein 6-like [Vulpes lagopus]|uniref:methyl-CpG-binding domain protein 6-like n=1 Tax=Vulpes lagopus TaxID=494514 RepID=UPI001BC8E011|nr:methyl-CpG-binding domain protein 6-like [Vulpes lagopus]